MKKRVLVMLGLCVLMFVLMELTGCGKKEETASGKAAKGDDYVMQISNKPILCQAPVHIADAMGYFKEEGLKYNLYNTAVSDYDLMVSGKNDVIYGLLPTMIQRISNGMDIRLVMGAHYGCINAVTLKKSGINSIKDLKGKKIGVPGLASDPAVLLQRILKANGIGSTPGNMEVELVVFNDTDLEMALNKGLVDAIISWDPFATAVAARGDGKILFNQATDELTKNEHCCLIAFSSEFLAKHPESALKFCRAIQKACDYIRKHPKEAAKLQLDTNNCSSKDLALNAKLLASYNYDGKIETARLSTKKTVQDCIDLKIINTKLTADEFVNKVFVKLAGLNEPSI